MRGRGKREGARGKKEEEIGKRILTFLFLLSFSLFPFSSSAQTPDLRAHLDLALTLDYKGADHQDARLYNPLGRPSVASISALFESGYRLFVAERLQRFPHDADGDIFDEAYVEDPGFYRVGKQYLPFGTGRLLHDSVVAFRIDSNLVAENLPVTLAACNSGTGRDDGVLLRVGRGVGASFAYGEHFGISATSLGVIRRPDQAPGRNGGWKQAFGFDATRRLGAFSVSGEFVALSGGPERDLSVFDFEATYAADGYHSYGVGYSRPEGATDDGFLRLFARVHAGRNLDLEPLLRLRDAGLYDAAITLRLRL